MDTAHTDQDSITIATTKPDLAELGMLLEWIIDNKQVMDEGSIALDKDEITLALRRWLTLVLDAIQ